MRKFTILVALAGAAFATHASANEGRIEARGGVAFGSGSSEAIAGVAAGYDFDLGSSAFIGAEVSADKILEDNTRIALGFSARAGVKINEKAKLYAIGGYQTKPCQFCDESWNAGAGLEFPLGRMLYGKLEYRHYFLDHGIPDYNTAVAGLGIKF